MELLLSATMKRKVYELLRAMLCNLSWNFRAVWLEEIDIRTINLRFLLEQEDEADREAIDDIAAEFEAQQDQRVNLTLAIHVSDNLQSVQGGQGYLVYARWES